MYKKLGIGIAVIMAGIALTTLSTSAVFATTDPNTVGKVTSQAQEDYREAGDPSGGGRHAADPSGDGLGPEDRVGLANVLGRGEGPQSTIEFVCGVDPDAAGCSALDN